MNEEWREVPTAPGYFVSNYGQVLGKRGGILRSSAHIKSGHRQVNLCLGGRNRQATRYVHQLVLEAFVGQQPDGSVCRHLDGDESNNRLENLTYGTHSENIVDAYRHGSRSSQRGESAGRAILSEDQVHEIRRLAQTGITQREIARIFGVGKSTVNSIIQRKNWGWMQ